MRWRIHNNECKKMKKKVFSVFGSSFHELTEPTHVMLYIAYIHEWKALCEPVFRIKSFLCC